MHITSRSNPNVKRWKALATHPLQERDHLLIWVEGVHLVQEAQRAGLPLVEVIVCEVAMHAGLAPTHTVDAAVMATVSQLESAASIAAVVRLNTAPIELVTTDCLVLDCVQDPGNVGTMLRTAWAFGIQHVLLTPGCASPWSMKALRAGQGAQFWLSIRERVTAPQIADVLRVPLLVTSVEQSSAVAAVDLRKPNAFVFGHEGQGVSGEINALAAQRVRIDMPGGAESLNVAAACAICLYEQQRQRNRVT